MPGKAVGREICTRQAHRFSLGIATVSLWVRAPRLRGRRGQISERCFQKLFFIIMCINNVLNLAEHLMASSLSFSQLVKKVNKKNLN